MIISSVRLGHASSSSSTHSILLNSKSPARLPVDGEFQYGWDWFHIKDREGKAKYLAALIFTVLGREMAPEHAAIIARELTGYNPLTDQIRPGRYSDLPSLSAYVDHQSVPVFPMAFDQKHYDPQFMAEFVKCIRDDPRVSIRGGNDNADEHENWVEGDPHLVDALNRDGPGRVYCRKDGSWWVLFNRLTGAKIRLSFAKNPAPYLKASVPELVDVKITNCCDQECGFCYQDSGKSGRHADPELLSSIAYACREKKIFEVVLGGGEPTRHPQFGKVLHAFDMYGISVSFTAYDMRWIRDETITKDVIERASSFAVSSPYCIKEISNWNGRSDVPKASLHIPLGCHDQKTLRRALVQAEALNVPVTFLGFKKTGRGKAFPMEDYKWVLDHIVGSDAWRRFGADSAFVLEFGEELKARGISEKLMVNREGAFSCYIDAVGMKVGASSYAADFYELPEDRNACFSRFPYVP